MELRQLRTFQRVATTLSFTRAAEELGYAQSSVTAQVRSLEDELSVRLFDRLGRQVFLTDAGQRLLEYATRLLNLAEETRLAVTESGEPSGQLVVAAPETLSSYRLPPLLKQYRARFPRVQLIMRSLLVGETLAQLSDGRVDVAIMLTDTLPQERAFRVRPLVAERFLLLAAPEHPLARQSRVQAEDLHDETLLLTEAGCSYRLAFEQELKTAGVRLSTIMEFGSVEAIKQCAMANLGIGFLPEIAACEEVKQGRLVALRWFAADFRMMTQLIWHRDKWLSVALSAFIEMTEQVLIPAGAPTGD